MHRGPLLHIDACALGNVFMVMRRQTEYLLYLFINKKRTHRESERRTDRQRARHRRHDNYRQASDEKKTK